MVERATEIQRVARQMRKATQDDIEAQKPRILLMGPKLTGKTLGAKLRQELSNRCWALGVPVTAEHDAMQRAGRGSSGRRQNLTNWELMMAGKSQLVVVIPDSPGSFAELGVFSMSEPMCPRMLVLFRKKHRNSRSYIQEGPGKLAKRKGASINFVDYSSVDEAWKRVEARIRQAKEDMAVNRLFLSSQ